MMVNVKQQNDEYEKWMQDDPRSEQVSMDRDFQMMLLEILGAIKIAIDTISILFS